MEKDAAGKNPLNYCHVEVEAGEMFLHLLVKGDATMKTIDGFLRDIWLECCGHLSGFGHKNFKIKMKDFVEDVFQPKIKIYHDYDYGKTCEDFDDYAKMPVVNSPRMGECGYTGGRIDKARDRVYKK